MNVGKGVMTYYAYKTVHFDIALMRFSSSLPYIYVVPISSAVGSACLRSSSD